MSNKEDIQYFRSGIATFVFIFSLNKFGRYFNSNRKTKNEIKRLEKIPIKSLQEIAKEAMNQSKSNIYFIEGIPQAGKLQSTFKKIPVILKIKQRTSLFSTDSFLEPRIKFNWKEAAISTDYTIDTQPFFTFLDKSSQTSAIVSINDSTNIESALVSFGFKDEKRSLSFAEHMGNVVTVVYSSLFRILGPASLVQVLFRDGSFRGVHIGYRDNEFGIRAEGLLSILGSLSYDISSKALRIENPLALTASKNTYIYQLERKLQENCAAKNFWLIVALISGLYLSRRIQLYHRKHPQILQRIKSTISRLYKKFKRNKQTVEPLPDLRPDEKKAQEQNTPTVIE